MLFLKASMSSLMKIILVVPDLNVSDLYTGI